ncbi:MAG: guanylate kinase [Planctomycetaceae bacterium]|nr:guanylate kinase [Planctomycetaceae bacterium]
MSNSPSAEPGGPSKVTGRVVVLSGPSGSGKTTIVNRLIAESSVPLCKSVSATTRRPRPQETDGEDYYFLSDEEFRQRLAAGEFLEHAEVFSSGFLYGTLKSEVQRAWDAQSWSFLEIDVEGALNVMREYPDAVTIFLKTPSPQEFERRLRARGTENEEVIQKRLATAARELQYADRYRYIVVNDDLDRAVSEICGILRDAAVQTAQGP